MLRKLKFKYKILIALILLTLVVVGSVLAINFYVISSAELWIVDQDQTADLDADCILVLGAGLKPDGTPNHMLQDRLDEAILLYNTGAASKILLSGDNGQEHYDEVNAMRVYVEGAGIPEEDVFLDHAGFSTYESMVRAREIFQVQSAVVVTQRYHQYRALYLARGLGIEAWGVSSDPRLYVGQSYRDLREILARNKDFFYLMIKPDPTYLGEEIPISGSGLETRD